jgi:hypothetical protein
VQQQHSILKKKELHKMTDETSTTINNDNNKPLLMLPGPEWPQFDFVYRSELEQPTNTSNFTIAGYPIYTHISTSQKSVNEATIESTVVSVDHAIKTSSSVWNAVSQYLIYVFVVMSTIECSH